MSPTALWSAITVLCVAIAGVVNAQRDMSGLKETVAELKREHVESLAWREEDRERLQKLEVSLAVMANQIADERQWRERIEGIAQSPPHARRR